MAIERRRKVDVGGVRVSAVNSSLFSQVNIHQPRQAMSPREDSN